MNPSVDNLRLIIQSALALAHALPLLLLVFRRQQKKYSVIPLISYCVLSVIWGASTAIANLGPGRIAPDVVRIAGYARTDLPVALAALLIPIAYDNFERPHHWIWLAGPVWCVVTLGLHLYFGAAGTEVPPVSVTTGALIGWLIFSSLVIGLSARWTVQAPMGFYRNRGIYYLALLILLLTGQALIWMEAQWSEIGLILHLLGAAALLACATTRHLPNIKGLLRRGFGTIVLTMTTALLLLLGLLVGQFLSRILGNRYTSLIAIVTLAVGLALIYRPFHRLTASLVNRLLWRRGYDLSQVLGDYGRTISNLLTVEQLTTVAVGTVNEILEVQRGAIVTLSRAHNRIALRVVEGMGSVEEKEIQIPLNSPVLINLMMSGEPFFQYELDHRSDLAGAPSEEMEWLRGLGMEIYLPIMARERLLGLLTLGAQGSGEPYGTREIDFLTTLAQQTGVALQNAYMFGEMRDLYAKISGLNEDLRKAYIKLQKLDRAKTDFLSIASHELRTPLTVVKGYTDILEEMADTYSLTPEQTAEIIHSLRAPVKRLETIVTAMLDASKIEVNALDLYFTSATLKATVALAIEPWQEALEERELELALDGFEEIPEIEIDVERLGQAFSNIISNAIKFTPDGGQISITATLLEDAQHFQVTIADTGVGIAKENQAMIFEKFYRVGNLLRHSTGDTKFKGAGPGLGLHIAKGVVEAHGGRIWVESEGHDEERCPGSAFHILLPLQPSPAIRSKAMPDVDDLEAYRQSEY